jgi:glutathionylspermidine synthase
MIKLKKLTELPDKIYQDLGWDWFLGGGEWKYLTSDIVLITTKERDDFYAAANELYQMLVEAADYVVDNNLWKELAIPKNIVELIKLTWNDERHFHLYGRFDFAGGVDGLPIKLIEFNADTATTLPETAIIQWAQLKANGIAEEKQFNFVYDALVDNFKRLKEMNADLYPSLLVSAMGGTPEDDANVEVIGEAAKEAGFEVEYRHVEEVVFSPTDGIFVDNGDDNYKKFDFWFKLVPWEYIAYEEPNLMHTLTEIVKNRKAMIINPAYTLLFQSKGILKYLWDLYKEHPLLLRTDFEEPYRLERYVEKVLLGREGQNVTVYDETGIPIGKVKGDYEQYPSVFQEYADFGRDKAGSYYQPGVFFAYEACGVGFRKGKIIIDDDAEFLGHVVED